jgi:hypothetical protein
VASTMLRLLIRSIGRYIPHFLASLLLEVIDVKEKESKSETNSGASGRRNALKIEEEDKVVNSLIAAFWR